MRRRNLFQMMIVTPLAALGIKAKRKPLASEADVLRSFDARDWARHFVEYVRQNPDIADDKETMTTWFANALMRGYDEARRKSDAVDWARFQAMREDVNRVGPSVQICGAVARG